MIRRTRARLARLEDAARYAAPERPAIVVQIVAPDGCYTGEEFRRDDAGRRVKTFNAALAGTRCPTATTPGRAA